MARTSRRTLEQEISTNITTDSWKSRAYGASFSHARDSWLRKRQGRGGEGIWTFLDVGERRMGGCQGTHTHTRCQGTHTHTRCQGAEHNPFQRVFWKPPFFGNARPPFTPPPPPPALPDAKGRLNRRSPSWRKLCSENERACSRYQGRYHVRQEAEFIYNITHSMPGHRSPPRRRLRECLRDFALQIHELRVLWEEEGGQEKGEGETGW